MSYNFDANAFDVVSQSSTSHFSPDTNICLALVYHKGGVLSPHEVWSLHMNLGNGLSPLTSFDVVAQASPAVPPEIFTVHYNNKTLDLLQVPFQGARIRRNSTKWIVPLYYTEAELEQAAEAGNDLETLVAMKLTFVDYAMLELNSSEAGLDTSRRRRHRQLLQLPAGVEIVVELVSDPSASGITNVIRSLDGDRLNRLMGEIGFVTGKDVPDKYKNLVQNIAQACKQGSNPEAHSYDENELAAEVVWDFFIQPALKPKLEKFLVSKGSKLGAKLGAIGGSAIAPVAGTVLGAAGGAIVGGFLGGKAADYVEEAIKEHIAMPAVEGILRGIGSNLNLPPVCCDEGPPGRYGWFCENVCPVECAVCDRIAGGKECVSPPPYSAPSPPPPPGCRENCHYAGDGMCDDGGPGAEYSFCTMGEDCTDCGTRPEPPPAPPAPPPEVSPSPVPPPAASPPEVVCKDDRAGTFHIRYRSWQAADSTAANSRYCNGRCICSLCNCSPEQQMQVFGGDPNRVLETTMNCDSGFTVKGTSVSATTQCGGSTTGKTYAYTLIGQCYKNAWNGFGMIRLNANSGPNAPYGGPQVWTISTRTIIESVKYEGTEDVVCY
jgi:hypothetical protein